MLICNKVRSFVHLRNGCSTNFPVLQPEEFNARYLTDMESCPDGQRKKKKNTLWVFYMQVNTVWLSKMRNLHRLELKAFYLTL